MPSIKQAVLAVLIALVIYIAGGSLYFNNATPGGKALKKRIGGAASSMAWVASDSVLSAPVGLLGGDMISAVVAKRPYATMKQLGLHVRNINHQAKFREVKRREMNTLIVKILSNHIQRVKGKEGFSSMPMSTSDSIGIGALIVTGITLNALTIINELARSGKATPRDAKVASQVSDADIKYYNNAIVHEEKDLENLNNRRKWINDPKNPLHPDARALKAANDKLDKEIKNSLQKISSLKKARDEATQSRDSLKSAAQVVEQPFDPIQEVEGVTKMTWRRYIEEQHQEREAATAAAEEEAQKSSPTEKGEEMQEIDPVTPEKVEEHPLEFEPV